MVMSVIDNGIMKAKQNLAIGCIRILRDLNIELYLIYEFYEIVKFTRIDYKKGGIALPGLFVSNFWTILLLICIGLLTASCCFTPKVLSKTISMINKVGNIDHSHQV